MAKIKWSALVSEISGKLNGSVIARGKNYVTIRNRVIPVNVQSSFQMEVRQIFGIISKNWSTLTEEQRQAWNNAVPQWIGTGIFADALTLSGKSLYQKLNNNLIMNGYEGISEPPVKTIFPAVNYELTYTIGGGAIQLGGTIRTIDNQNFGVNDLVAVWRFSKVASAGTSNLKGKAITLSQEDIATNVAILTTDLKDEYIQRFGTLGYGTILGEVFILNKVTGERSLGITEVKTLMP